MVEMLTDGSECCRIVVERELQEYEPDESLFVCFGCSEEIIRRFCLCTALLRNRATNVSGR